MAVPSLLSFPVGYGDTSVMGADPLDGSSDRVGQRLGPGLDVLDLDPFLLAPRIPATQEKRGMLVRHTTYFPHTDQMSVFEDSQPLLAERLRRSYVYVVPGRAATDTAHVTVHVTTSQRRDIRQMMPATV